MRTGESLGLGGNQDKSNVMIFGRKCEKKFYLGEQIVKGYKYLGLMLDSNFTWKEHLEKILKKARKRTRALCALRLREGVSARALLRGWQILVRPVLEDGAEIGGRKFGSRVSNLTMREVIQGDWD